MTSIPTLFPFLRALLGDRQVMGSWHYAESDLLSAVRTVFALGRGPEGYALDGSVFTATQIAPDLEVGDAMAIVLYEAALITVGGEDGAKSIRTRELTVADSGHRKRDLLLELRHEVHRIRNGSSVFTSRQTLSAFLGAGDARWSDFTGLNLVTTPGEIRV